MDEVAGPARPERPDDGEPRAAPLKYHQERRRRGAGAFSPLGSPAPRPGAPRLRLGAEVGTEDELEIVAATQGWSPSSHCGGSPVHDLNVSVGLFLAVSNELRGQLDGLEERLPAAARELARDAFAPARVLTPLLDAACSAARR